VNYLISPLGCGPGGRGPGRLELHGEVAQEVEGGEREREREIEREKMR
jgi:hypothetical protein